MRKYVLEISAGQKNTAGSKAKKDITKILQNNGFTNLNLRLPKSKLLKLFFAKHIIRKMIRNFKEDDIFVIQYPMYSTLGTDILLKESKKRKVKTICIIHDIESLRLYKNNESKIRREQAFLNRFDCLIVHNDEMKKWLFEQGISKPMISLEIFDYLTKQQLPEVSMDLNVIFAGNLEKSTFLKKWNLDKKITVFGINPSKLYPHSVLYEGVKNPDELPEFLSGSFGLVWDGDSIETNNGIFGEYTRYNNPHKVSLYLSCGLPVIVWKEAAISSFIEKNELGITVSSLDELSSVFDRLTGDEYLKIRENTTRISSKIRQGYFIKKAVKLAINTIS
ncbi:sugar transferase [Pediococcus pentosaceus]|uniref:sugar transferase n=1 Tax=Pediococcus pentosaceus TaxID=1255 RepID=UPI001E65CB9D|nr:sugar transferase [Pediococcus pentosaceus]MCD5257400.1 sugar transferase [Pediococcus pentosaceus]